jgi:hypothetical protein
VYVCFTRFYKVQSPLKENSKENICFGREAWSSG